MAYTIKKLDNKISKLYKQIEHYKHMKDELAKSGFTYTPTQAVERSYYIYTIKCENDCYYVGQTTNPERRLKQHRSGTASWFTRQNKPIEMIDIVPIGVMTNSRAMEWENKITAQLIKQHGLHKVRGGAFIQKNHKHFIHKLNEYQEVTVTYDEKYDKKSI